MDIFRILAAILAVTGLVIILQKASLGDWSSIWIIWATIVFGAYAFFGKSIANRLVHDPFGKSKKDDLSEKD